ncbi:MAG: twin-arginine translocase TatA/TatE family subunit [Planctomycetaceae bacterium]
MFGLGPVEIVLLGAVAVMLYGKRLPEVGRSVGKVVGDLRRQWTSLARELDVSAHIDGSAGATATGSRRAVTATRPDDDDVGLVSGPRFDPPESEAASGPS